MDQRSVLLRMPSMPVGVFASSSVRCAGEQVTAQIAAPSFAALHAAGWLAGGSGAHMMVVGQGHAGCQLSGSLVPCVTMPRLDCTLLQVGRGPSSGCATTL